MEKYGRARQATDDNIILRTRFVRWISKATNTHSEYVILTASPRQQQLHEYASVLRLYVLYNVYVFSYSECLALQAQMNRL